MYFSLGLFHAMKSDTIRFPEKLAFLLFVIRDDPQLDRWFRSLHGLSPEDRALEVGTLTRRMAEAGRDPKIIDALHFLADSRQFEIAHQAIAEIEEEDQQT